ncbi:GNAT family N-acetyltransferase [Actinokineospora sp. HUAS TT18]|uniref:GNAT family N-acetyltransferase n=1 Tax=Actinokineospora sp. HUAS TT18 TaxID=3447451 RepID=UPI003F51E4EE
MPTIRTFEDRDQDAVTALSLRAWAPVFASLRNVLGPLFDLMHTDWRVDQRRAVEAVCQDVEIPTWVAEVDGAVAGFVACKLDHGERMGEIYMIAVDPDHQRRGVGAELADFALNWFKDNGMALALVETGGDPGHAPARRAYERAGFTPLHTVKYFKAL